MRFGTLILALLCTSVFSEHVYSAELTSPPKDDRSYESYAGAIATTALANLLTISYGQYPERVKEYTLKDGTKISGFLFKRDNEPRPLMICNYGVLTDRWSSPISGFIKHLIFEEQLKVNFFIMDSVSGASFGVANGGLSLGGYDEGRVMVGLAEKLREDHLDITTLHLMGVSLGGLAVAEALIEDARLKTAYFTSGISFSGAIDEENISNSVLATYGYQMKMPIAEKVSEAGSLLMDVPIMHFNQTLDYLGHKNDVKLSTSTAGKIFYDQFTERLHRLAANPITKQDWNPEVKTDTVENYLHTSSELIVKYSDTIRVPFIVTHAKNDPLVPYAGFDAFEKREMGNPLIQTYGTEVGGHWGYLSAYSAHWIESMLERMLYD